MRVAHNRIYDCIGSRVESDIRIFRSKEYTWSSPMPTIRITLSMIITWATNTPLIYNSYEKYAVACDLILVIGRAGFGAIQK